MNKPLPFKRFHTTLDGTVQKIYRTATKDCKACPINPPVCQIKYGDRLLGQFLTSSISELLADNIVKEAGK